MPTVAFQGVRGAYSEQAIFHYFGPDTQTVPYESLEEIFEGTSVDKRSTVALLTFIGTGKETSVYVSISIPIKGKYSPSLIPSSAIILNVISKLADGARYPISS